MDDFRKFEAEAWQRKAELYEPTWGAVTKSATTPLLQHLRLKRREKLLDVGCGPGHFCKAAADLGADVMGCDLSSRMVEIAQRNYPGLSFRVEDAEHLSFASGTFSVVTLNYLLLHVADQSQVLGEAARVLKDEGKLGYVLWLPPEESPGFKLILGAIRKHADSTVVPPAPDIFQFARPAQANTTLRDLGLELQESVSLDLYWMVSSAKELFNAIQAGSRIGGMLELQNDEVKKKILDDIRDGLEVFKASSGYCVPVPSVLVTARKV